MLMINIDQGPWLMFEGSVGDLYILASLLSQSPLFEEHGFKLICPTKNKELLRAFVGELWINDC